jgi:hypothetical protein
MVQSMQTYLRNAVDTLEKFGVMPNKDDENGQLTTLLEGVASIDEPKVLAIAGTLKYMSSYNELVRENIEDMNFSNRFNNITKMFESIREDSKKIIAQLDDGKVDLGEKVSNLWMKLCRGTPHDRFEKINDVYKDVAKDTKDQIDREREVLDGYQNFRLAVKSAEKLAYEVLETQTTTWEKAKVEYNAKHKLVEDFKGEESKLSEVQLIRDEAKIYLDSEEKKYQLMKDIAENLRTGYNVGEALIAKIQQTHTAKERVYERAVTFFTTNEHVFTTLDMAYTSVHGLYESTKTVDAMAKGVNKGLEDIAELGTTVQKEALKVGYGTMIEAESLKKLVDSIVSYEKDSKQLIQQYRDESTQNTKEIVQIMEDGKKQMYAIVNTYAQ